ncbi:MAG TPA: hypothetical protein VJ600_08635 [Holophagaceae bacterium]|nr:hypothetical protein [Holophagaceae bacterium]
MRTFAALTLLMSLTACHGPEPAPFAAQGPKLAMHFLDGDAALPLAGVPTEGTWAVMNMGVWEKLRVQWKPEGGDCTLARVSPSWLLFKDPSGKVHRLILHGPGPQDTEDHSDPRLDPDKDILGWNGLSWVWKRR